MQLEGWLSILALVVSFLALLSRWWVPRRERQMKLLADCHRRVEKINLEVELRIDEETGVLPDPHPYWYDDVHEEFLKALKIYRRVKALLAGSTVEELEKRLSEIEEIRTERPRSGAGERIGVIEGTFIRLLESSLDKRRTASSSRPQT